MADWCENSLTVEGPKGAIEKFLQFAAGESPFDFNRFIPYPEEFQRLDEITEAWDREHAGRRDYDWHAGRRTASIPGVVNGGSRIGARNGPRSTSRWKGP